jgi:hypothetical protein
MNTRDDITQWMLNRKDASIEKSAILRAEMLARKREVSGEFARILRAESIVYSNRLAR